MFFIFEILLSSLYFISSYDSIPINNFEKKFFKLTKNKDFVIFSYCHPGSENVANYVHKIRKTYLGMGNLDHLLYMYEDISKIKRTVTGGFDNYNWRKDLKGKDNYIEFEDTHSLNKTYYFIIQNKIESIYDYNVTLVIYSTYTITNISNIVQAYLKSNEIINNLTYKFQVPLEHKKYLLLKYDTLNKELPGNFIIYENGETLISNYSGLNTEKYIELKSESFYIIYFNLMQIKTYSKGGYLFIAQSAYSRYMPVDINTNYFEEYPFIKTVYLLLNFTTIKKGYKMMFEYDNYFDKEFEYTSEFYLYGYNTEDSQIIENTEGNSLDFIDVYPTYEGDIYQLLIEKDIMSNTKLIVLEVKNLIKYVPDEFYFFQIRYGKQFVYPTRTVFILIGFGLALSFPNILVQIIRRCKEIEMPNKLSLFMDIILHLAYSNIAVIFINSELHPGFYLGITF